MFIYLSILDNIQNTFKIMKYNLCNTPYATLSITACILRERGSRKSHILFTFILH